jgi:catechol 2,3-dioxygenase-like lactoylglutathione lyase family enzyme
MKVDVFGECSDNLLPASAAVPKRSFTFCQGFRRGSMLKYHHLGIPTREVRAGERFLPDFGMYVSGYETSPFRIEWMRFEPDSPVPPLVQQVPHVAFEVDDLEAALEDRKVLIAPNSPSPGIQVAFVVDDGAPVELIQVDDL